MKVWVLDALQMKGGVSVAEYTFFTLPLYRRTDSKKKSQVYDV